MRAIVTAFICAFPGISIAGNLPRAITADDFSVPAATSVLLGRDLFFDPVLSGNRNIACATCHMPANATSDAEALRFGEGGEAKGRRIARHTPALFNLGAQEFTTLMYDGRIATDDDSRFGIRLPEGQFLERPLASPLAAQALMPIVAPDEMVGQPGSNPVADAVAEGRITGMDGAWHLLARRVAGIPEYRRRFDWLIGADEPLHITHIAQVLADFISFEFRATDSPFDDFLRGEDGALSNAQLRGMALFYGKAGCATCHSGPFQTDHGFHAIGLPQIGPGKAHGPDHADHGRGAITNNPADMYRFRTPSLRNVALTAPYGHSGAIPTLEAMIRHHLDPATALAEYLGEGVNVSLGAMEDFDEVLAITAAIRLDPLELSDSEVEALLDFLGALTDRSFEIDRLGPPHRVPSGLPPQGLGDAPS